jgi:hypothetical protein
MILKMKLMAAKTSKAAVVLLRQQRTTCIRNISSSSSCRPALALTLTLRSPVRFFSSTVMGTTSVAAELAAEVYYSERKRLYSSSLSLSQSQSQLSQSQSQSNSQESESESESLQIPYFKKVLIANRGEIAIRIARTCRKLNIKTVSIYTYNDTKSIHINECDESFCIGDSYLNIDKIMNAIKVTKSDAVHPGKFICKCKHTERNVT